MVKPSAKANFGQNTFAKKGNTMMKNDDNATITQAQYRRLIAFHIHHAIDLSVIRDLLDQNRKQDNPESNKYNDEIIPQVERIEGYLSKDGLS